MLNSQVFLIFIISYYRAKVSFVDRVSVRLTRFKINRNRKRVFVLQRPVCSLRRCILFLTLFTKIFGNIGYYKSKHLVETHFISFIIKNIWTLKFPNLVEEMRVDTEPYNVRFLPWSQRSKRWICSNINLEADVERKHHSLFHSVLPKRWHETNQTETQIIAIVSTILLFIDFDETK